MPSILLCSHLFGNLSGLIFECDIEMYKYLFSVHNNNNSNIETGREMWGAIEGRHSQILVKFAGPEDFAYTSQRHYDDASDDFMNGLHYHRLHRVCQLPISVSTPPLRPDPIRSPPLYHFI